jgi:hypothetical protein
LFFEEQFWKSLKDIWGGYWSISFGGKYEKWKRKKENVKENKERQKMRGKLKLKGENI